MLCCCCLRQAKLDETRRYYAQYNTLADVRKFLLKEVSLLNSSRTQFEAASAARDDGMKAAFAASLGEVSKGVDENLRRAEERLAREAATAASLAEAHAAAVAKQRAYFAAVKRFQDECRRGEELRAAAGAPQQA